jgi:hypothetical protein
MNRRLLPFAALSLLAGLAAGLARFGWIQVPWAAVHGPLMVCGFLGGMISLERAAAMDRPWAYGAPALAALGSVLLITGHSGWAAGSYVMAGAWMSGLHAVFFRRQPAFHTAVMLAGSLAWCAGSIAWFWSGEVWRAVPLWVAFPALMVAGERLELSRFGRMAPWVLPAFLAAAGLIFLGAVLSVWNPGGVAVLSFGLLAACVWLLSYDQGLRRHATEKRDRFSGLALKLGYAWLMAAALLGLTRGLPAAGPATDAFLHCFFLGYVFCMILAHAMLIFPALSGLSLTFHPGFPTALLMLNASLGLRLGGDLFSSWEARRWGGLFNGAAILTFLGSVAVAAWIARTKTVPASNIKVG